MISFLMATFLAVLPCTASELIHEPFDRAPVVFISIATPRGSASDPAGKSGLANLTGDLLLRGNQSKSKGELDLAIERLGAQLQVQTRLDSLNMTGAVLKSQLGPFLDLLTEILEKPALSEGELAKLKKEIEGQILEATADDGQLAKRRFLRFLFGNHPYGLPGDGRLQDLRSITLQDVKGVYPRLFRPDSLMIAVGGDTSAAEASQIQRRIEGALTAHKNAPPLPEANLPETANTPRLLIVDKPGRTQTRVFAGRIGLSIREPKFDAFAVANHGLGGGIFGSRLIKEIRVNRGWSYGAGSRQLISQKPNAWYMTYAPALKDTIPSIQFLRTLVTELSQKGLDPSEFQLAHDNLLKSSAFVANTPYKRLENAINERLLGLPKGYFAKQAARVQAIDRDKSKEALSQFLTQAPLTWTVVGPASELQKPLEEALGLKPGSAVVRPYQEDF
jgi:zinc protease